MSDENEVKEKSELEILGENLSNDLKVISEKYNCFLLVGVHIKDKNMSNVLSFGEKNSLEQSGLAREIYERTR